MATVEKDYPQQIAVDLYAAVAAAAITKGQAVKIAAVQTDGRPSVTPTTADTDDAIGIATKSAAIGETLNVKVLGFVNATASAVIAVGAYVKVGASGKVATVTTGRPVLGRCVHASTGDNTIAGILLGVAPVVGA